MPRDNPKSIPSGLGPGRTRDPGGDRRLFWIVALAAAVAGTVAAIVYARLDLTLSHYDARAHLVVSRRVFDSLTPGWRQLGALWLPLPHLINAVPVQWDAAYRSGMLAVAISIGAMACGLGALARHLHHAGVTAWASAIITLGILANPSVLYLQSTPMTEPLLIGASLVALHTVGKFLASDNATDLKRAGLSLSALVLIRYEGWLVAAGLLAIAALTLGLQRVRLTLRLASFPVIAILAFLCLSKASTGAWFVAGGFFVPENPALRQPLTALDQITTGLRELAGSGIVIAGGLGGLTALLFGLRRPAAVLPVALALPLLLPLLAFTSGHPFRIRYMIPLVAACWSLAGVGLAQLPRRWQVFLAALLVVLALVQVPPFAGGTPMVIEAQRERPQQRARDVVTRYLASHHDRTPILASMGSLGHYMQETSAIGLDIRDFVHEGNGDLWAGALERPSSHVNWILIEEAAEGGDVLFARARSDGRFLEGFGRVAEGGGVALYRRSEARSLR
jgi:hypothetical protein